MRLLIDEKAQIGNGFMYGGGTPKLSHSFWLSNYIM